MSIDKYQCKKKLGRGSFGDVYEAYNVVLKEYTAIKILKISSPEQALDLFNEASIPYNCKHENIVRIKTALISGENFIIDMELVNDGTLEDKLKNNTLSVVDAIRYIKQVMFGLQHAHTNGVIHRDIKPANILIHNDQAKLSDFGLAIIQNMESKELKWYISHTAPEIYDSHAPTVLSDIYALGMTLYRAINGIADWRKFLQKSNDHENLLKKGELIKKLGFTPSVPKKLQKVVNKACHKDPTKRYQTVTEMREALEKLSLLYSWSQQDDNTWIGTSVIPSNPKQSIHLIEKKKTKIQIKSNNRKVTSLCREFNSKEEALIYVYEFIAENTVS